MTGIVEKAKIGKMDEECWFFVLIFYFCGKICGYGKKTE